MQTAQQNALGKSEAAVTSALRNVYFAAKHDLANVVVPELNDLCIKQVCIQIVINIMCNFLFIFL
jgi:hypothetical protein